MARKPDRVREIAAEISKLVSELGNEEIAPCEQIYGERISCMTHEKQAADKYNKTVSGNSRGYHDYRPARMCDACAAYWHASCAMARALVAAQRQEIFADDADAKEKKGA